MNISDITAILFNLAVITILCTALWFSLKAITYYPLKRLFGPLPFKWWHFLTLWLTWGTGLLGLATLLYLGFRYIVQNYVHFQML